MFLGTPRQHCTPKQHRNLNPQPLVKAAWQTPTQTQTSSVLPRLREAYSDSEPRASRIFAPLLLLRVKSLKRNLGAK